MPHKLLRCEAAPQFCKHSESADFLRKSLLPHVEQSLRSNTSFCKQNRCWTLGPLGIIISKFCFFVPSRGRFAIFDKKDARFVKN